MEMGRLYQELSVNENPLISIIIPLYNSGNRFILSLDSVLSQTYRPIEVLLIDDGSTDNTSSIGAEVALLNDNVYYYRKENGGVGSARNFGIKKASGEYFALCDHDDLWHRTKLEKQIQLFSEESVGLVYTGANFLEARDNYDSDDVFAPKDRTYYEGNVYYDLLKYNFICASSVLFSRTALNKVGLFADTFDMHGVDDKNMWLRIAHDFEVQPVKETLTCWIRSESNWSKNEVKMMRSALFCLDDIFKRFPETSQKGMVIKNEAYRQIYLHFGVNFFNLRDYTMAKMCFLSALKHKQLCPIVLLYYACSFLPPIAIDMLRIPKKAMMLLIDSKQSDL